MLTRFWRWWQAWASGNRVSSAWLDHQARTEHYVGIDQVGVQSWPIQR